MSVALAARPSHDASMEMLNIWMSLSPDEREAFIRDVRDQFPGKVKIADAFERLHLSMLARA